ncbi:helicase-related protein [Nitrospirillum sp. BR 11828]|uniref:helicase-related protein n=1 Tax=Nitrospirillum sp. BR 11828 TaxID=3104325 RepID=UPI002AC9F751|nr:helicase-related protein [Nitrospirillum sp. BR 11828]MDZ5649439.1 helicase-related protein [Nitrospirillum sp. BR 11828]
MTSMPDKSPDRDALVRRLNEDLLGPRRADETLSDRPSDVYLTGILWPQRTEMAGEDDDTLAAGGVAGGGDGESNETDSVPINSVQKPCVAGVSFCVTGEPARADIRVRFGRYAVQEQEERKQWVRNQIEVVVTSLELSEGSRTVRLSDFNPAASGAQMHIRSISSNGSLLVTVSLINGTPPGAGRDELEMASMFQTSLHITPGEGTKLVPKPTSRSASGRPDQGDADEKSNSLLFRNVYEFASGHVCAASWGPVIDEPDQLPVTEWIATSWIPSSTVPGVNPNGHELFSALGKNGFDPLSALALTMADQLALRAGLNSVCDCYERWLKGQEELLAEKITGTHALTGRANLDQCANVLVRMRRAIDEICNDPLLTSAFRLSNLAMHTQHQWDPEKSKHGALRWRPFQLGFLLLSGVSAARSDHDDREVMDLLWFPTGGGKTEAYLALIAMVAFYRRLAAKNAGGAGVAALMRYTLRLLTTQQFARSAAMILACEAIRSERIATPQGQSLKGLAPFSIGLWVGGDASPNSRANAYAALQGARELASPEQLALCPACQAKIRWTQASVASPVIPRCESKGCVLEGPLPVWTVDEDVYDQHPTLLVGTVDKFAQIVRRPETNALFGIAAGNPPDLIIQDELHLISGPLGTVAGTYESAFDILFSKDGCYPKVIGSTATIRRASEQVLDLFDRSACQFPPPAINHDNSGFAVLDPKSTGRRYVGVSTAGRSAKFTLQAVAASLLQSAAGAFSDDRTRDPYWTLIGYFNSLRELGGALVLMQDDVSDSIRLYSSARGEKANIRAMHNVEELTSRRTQEEILEMLSRLAIRAGQAGALDTVLATNMVSVGVDIPRLGLMIVNGQPKAIAEYIQATSRVGRGSVSGLVVSVLNNAKARDRSRFETFSGWHQTLYRDVEATSVTPFASRARDRALHAALVAAIRHLAPGMLNSPVLNDPAISKAEELIDLIVERAERIDPEEKAVRYELERKLDQWIARAPEHYWQDRKENASLLLSAERAAWKKALGQRPGSAWPTLNSMRTVETGTPFRLAPVLKEKGDSHGE